MVVGVAGGNSLGPCPEHPTCWVQSCQLGVKRMGSSWDVEGGEAQSVGEVES